MTLLAGQVVVVSGVGPGLGRSIALASMPVAIRPMIWSWSRCL